MATLTTANTVFMLAIDTVFPNAQQLQGYAADDVTDFDSIEATEAVMGVDGILSAGFVNMPIKQNITLQADSLSNAVFDTWYQFQKQAQDVFFAQGVLVFPGLGTKYNLTRGSLVPFKPVPDARRILQPRKFGITWQSVIAAVLV